MTNLWTGSANVTSHDRWPLVTEFGPHRWRARIVGIGGGELCLL